MPSNVRYVHHRNVEFKEFQTPVGMVGRWVTKKAEEVAAHAILLAPKPGQGQGYATGELARNIKAEPARLGRKGPEARVVAGTGHAKFVHEGTPPHIIRPSPGKQLVFFWRKVGHVVRMNSVKHPGTRAVPFLMNALRSVFGGPGR